MNVIFTLLIFSALTSRVCKSKSCMSFPVEASQTLIVAFVKAVITYLSSRLQTTMLHLEITLVSPKFVVVSWRLVMWSWLDEWVAVSRSYLMISRFGEGLGGCPLTVVTCDKTATHCQQCNMSSNSHSLAVPSELPVTRRESECDHEMAPMGSAWCPRRTWKSLGWISG